MLLNLPKDNTLFNFLRGGKLGLYYAIIIIIIIIIIINILMYFIAECPEIVAVCQSSFLYHWWWLSCDRKKSSYIVHYGLLQSCSCPAFRIELDTSGSIYVHLISKLGFSLVHIVLFLLSSIVDVYSSFSWSGLSILYLLL